MRTYHAEATVQPDGNIILKNLPFSKGERVEVTIVAPAHDEAKDWEALSEQEFLNGYSEKDSAYDNY